MGSAGRRCPPLAAAQSGTKVAQGSLLVPAPSLDRPIASLQCRGGRSTSNPRGPPGSTASLTLSSATSRATSTCWPTRAPVPGEPLTRQLDGKPRELRVYRGRQQTRITDYRATGPIIVVLAMFAKTRPGQDPRLTAPGEPSSAASTKATQRSVAVTGPTQLRADRRLFRPGDCSDLGVIPAGW